MQVKTIFSRIYYDCVLFYRKLIRVPFFFVQYALGKRINRREPQTINRVLLVRLQRLGDLMMTKPVISALREKYPEATIDILTASSVGILQPLFEHEIDNWYSYDSPMYQHPGSTRGKRTELRRILQGYDLIIDFDGDYFTVSIARMLRPGRYLSRGLTRVSQKLQRQEQGDGQLDLLFKIARLERQPDLHRGTRSVQRRKIIEIHPFTGARIRDPEPLFWRELIAELKNSLGDFKIVLTGYGKEAAAVASLAEETQSSVYSDDNDELHERFRQTAALVICPDTFTMHFAAYLGTPVIALYGPQSPARFSDFYPTVHAIYHAVPCSPCGYNNFGVDFCPRKNRCLQSITVAEVVDKAKQLLRDSG